MTTKHYMCNNMVLLKMLSNYGIQEQQYNIFFTKQLI